MARRFHIGRDGQPHECSAEQGKCPLGGEHYPTFEVAEHAAERLNENNNKNSNNSMKKATDSTNSSNSGFNVVDWRESHPEYARLDEELGEVQTEIDRLQIAKDHDDEIFEEAVKDLRKRESDIENMNLDNNEDFSREAEEIFEECSYRIDSEISFYDITSDEPLKVQASDPDPVADIDDILLYGEESDYEPEEFGEDMEDARPYLRERLEDATRYRMLRPLNEDIRRIGNAAVDKAGRQLSNEDRSRLSILRSKKTEIERRREKYDLMGRLSNVAGLDLLSARSRIDADDDSYNKLMNSMNPSSTIENTGYYNNLGTNRKNDPSKPVDYVERREWDDDGDRAYYLSSRKFTDEGRRKIDEAKSNMSEPSRILHDRIIMRGNLTGIPDDSKYSLESRKTVVLLQTMEDFSKLATHGSRYLVEPNINAVRNSDLYKSGKFPEYDKIVNFFEQDNK